ncbi:hypothetical protein [Sphingomonas dokdonensis]|uniref:Uncharacterized protein n=1 Tax=Sphingomonas dokdonensis TaxID=344880 RepID=A0A245ZGJ4_9SPHN|nr:hypothetical protein [Sphingomonas dokdonensis]OWK28870.1 hypothetical protein SPDO_27060 [Sphingomonas dokdonensis]
MADDVSTYRARANNERANAAATQLANVRDRCERAALAWDVMADRAERVTSQRIEREAQTAQRTAGSPT